MPPPPRSNNNPKQSAKTHQFGSLIKGAAPNSQRAEKVVKRFPSKIGKWELKRQVKEADRIRMESIEALNMIPDAESVILGEKSSMGKLISHAHGNRLTTGAHLRVAELDHDPIAFAVKIIKGEALTQNHPFLAYLFEKAAEYRDKVEKGKAIDFDGFIDDLIEVGKVQLLDSWTPPNLRADTNKDLLKYLYPTLKAVDHSGTINHQHLHITVLQETEAKIFTKAFNEDY
jgi:hypothetical protein